MFADEFATDEIVGIVEAQQVRHFAYAQTFHQEILGLVKVVFHRVCPES